MAKAKTYYFKYLDLNNFILTISKANTTKEPISTPTKTVITLAEYNAIKTVIANKPLPSDKNHDVKIKDNLDGTYEYIEVEIEEVVED